MGISPKRILKHLARMLLTLGLTVALIVGLSLLLTPVSTIADDSLIAHTVIAVALALPVLLVLKAAAILAIRFLNQFYDIWPPKEAYDFLSRLAFGQWSFGPYLLIKEGKIVAGKGSVPHTVGGPAGIVLYNDTAIVTERFGKPYRILEPGYPKLEPFEKVWEIIDLRPKRWPFKVNGMTREGIPVSCMVEVAFKIDDRIPDQNEESCPNSKRTATKPHPFTREAVFKAATSRWIRPPEWEGPPHDWTGRVMISATEGTLRNILAEYRLDWLITPTGSDQEHPRKVIQARLRESLEESTAKVGAMILDVKLGEIEVEHEQIPVQWMEAWKTEWECQAVALKAEGEAELLQMEIAQAQAQADMIINLIQSLQEVTTSKEELRPYLLATRFVHALRRMSFDPFTHACMPPEAMQSLRRIQEALEKGRLSSSEQHRGGNILDHGPLDR